MTLFEESDVIEKRKKGREREAHRAWGQLSRSSDIVGRSEILALMA